MHVMLFPALIIGAITTHLVILVRQKHAQYKGAGRAETNVVGKAFWPSQVFKSTGLLLLVAAILAFMGGLIQINPVWAYGPFDATTASAPAQPDWYVGWLEGALRLFPPVEFTTLGVTIPSTFIPGVVIPGIAFGVMTLWPFIEARVTGDRAVHHLLDNPRDVPGRVALGVGALAFFVVLTLAGGNDVLALTFDVGVDAITNVLRIAIFVVPLLAAGISYRIAKDLSTHDPGSILSPPTTMPKRNPGGGF